MKYFALAFVALLLAGCHHSFLSVRTEALYPSFLASEKIDTPDPCRPCFIGEQVVVHWRVPEQIFQLSSFHFDITLRYGDFSFETLTVPISQCSGYWTYQLLNERYWEKKGILAFKVVLYNDNKIFEKWTHHIWAEWIGSSL